jgi:uncharacterized pyridoxamine 5'-phosphate oxidase family protein
MFALAHEGKPYFATSNAKDVFRQLRAVPYAEFTASSAELVTVRVRGTVRFSGDRTLKKEILDRHAIVRSVYGSPDNPRLELFCIDSGEAVLSDFSGRPPKIVRF